ncbi:helix-turn-helix transcriptional regulator [Paenibacillus sp. PR3]|uniref:Helix-turn-helix transcriptional regulator n=1 Tax=Paenibacillus terricola TaxID=2763503 RepID=A0ABR8MWJ4_9BACL|nr:helix-turn-helix transcriptional regulator [Paenibacillus terricola]MBD3919275.1 helix-turn-helix transcriptional regulator [Paenibacillus terricola]
MPSNNLNQIAANMKRLRAEKGVTIGQIAGKTGVSYEVLTRIEKGTEPKVDQATLILIASYFGVKTDDLVGSSSIERYMVTGGRRIDLSDFTDAELTDLENYLIFLRWKRLKGKSAQQRT